MNTCEGPEQFIKSANSSLVAEFELSAAIVSDGAHFKMTNGLASFDKWYVLTPLTLTNSISGLIVGRRRRENERMPTLAL